jgi:hypothetical protein
MALHLIPPIPAAGPAAGKPLGDEIGNSCVNNSQTSPVVIAGEDFFFKRATMPSLLATLGLNASAFKAGLDSAVNQARSAGKAIGHGLGEIASGKVLQFASIAGVEEMIRHVVELGDHIATTSERLGISTDAVQSWDFALKQSGSSIEAAVPFFEKLASSRKKALEGNEDAIASFRALGVSIEKLKSDRLEDIGMQIAQAFENADPQKLIADLREVGGRSAGEMVGAFRDGFSEMVSNAKSMGVVMSESVVEQMKQGADRSEMVWTQFTVGFAQAMGALTENFIQPLWRGGQSAMETLVTLLRTGSAKATSEALGELEEQWKKEDDLIKERAEKRKKMEGNPAGLDETESKTTHQKIEATARERERLAERLGDLQNKHYLDSLSKEEKITELHRQRVELANWLAKNQSLLTDEGRLKAQIDLEELAGQEDAETRALNKPKSKKASSMKWDVNSLQQIGAYSAPAPHETQSLDLAKKSESHLAGMHAQLTTLVANSRGGVRH